MDLPLTDADILGRCVSEPASFSELYERHSRVVLRFVARRVGAVPAEDLAAEVFVRAFRSRANCRCEYGSALPWLLGVANHVVADHRRVERRRLETLERWAAETPGLVRHENASLAPELVHALRRLPAKDRDALLLVVWGELSYLETATALGVPVGTVRSRIARARRRLAAALGQAAPATVSEFGMDRGANA
jgi:RNA polymerase sigma-70 factor (ECF subfamily)